LTILEIDDVSFCTVCQLKDCWLF